MDESRLNEGREAGRRGDAFARRGRGIKALAWILGLLFALPAMLALVLIALALVVRHDPSQKVAPGFVAYASVPSVSALARDAIGLKALDAALSGPESAELLATIRSARASGLFASPAFMKAAELRADIAVYDGGAFVLAAELGLRSALARFAEPAARLLPGLLARVPGLSYDRDASPPRFIYETEGLTVYAAVRRNLLVAASDGALLKEALASRAADPLSVMAKTLAAKAPWGLRAMVHPELVGAALGQGGEGSVAALFGGLSYGGMGVVDLDLRDQVVRLAAALDARAGDGPLKPILERRSRTPAALTRLPASTAYFSLLAAGKPDELWKALAPALGEGAQAAYAAAQDGARLAFGQNLDRLLFSWMGDELGAFGVELGPSPIFFVAVADEPARRAAFEQLFASPFASLDLSAVAGGTRLARISFPRWMRSLLSAAGVELVEPFYAVYDGILYLCQSAEILGAALAELRDDKLLVKTERWRELQAGVSPESSAMLYYSLERGAPFFLRGQGAVQKALSIYGRGLASFRVRQDGFTLELSAMRSDARPLSSLPGFPRSAPGSIDAELLVGRAPDGKAMAYWTSGRKALAMELAGGRVRELELDDRAFLALELDGERIGAVWAASAKGTIYRCDAFLEAAPRFPVLSGEAIGAAPTAAAGRLYAPLAAEPALLVVDSSGAVAKGAALAARQRRAPTAAGAGLAVAPRSFDGRLYLLGADARPLAGWPAELEGIVGAAPVWTGSTAAGSAYGASAAPFAVAAVTEGGMLYAFQSDGRSAPGFPVALDGAFDEGLAWAPALASLFLADSFGALHRVRSDGSLESSPGPVRPGAAGIALVARDWDGDGLEEIFASGGGDALYAYDGAFRPLPAFPVAGAGRPSFIDLDGDGGLDLVVRGIDHAINAYALGR